MLVWFYKDPDTFWITISLSLFIIFGGFTMQQLAILRRQMRFRVVASIDVIAVIVGLGAGVAAAFAGWGYWALVVQQGTNQCVSMIVTWIAASWVPSRPARAEGVGKMLRFGAFFAGSHVANYGSNNVDKVVLAYYFSDALVGQYRNAFGLLMMPVQQMLVPLTNVGVSILSRTVDDPPRFRRAFLGALDHIAIATMPLMACSIACADWVVRIVMGPGWETAAEIFLILGFASLLQPVTNATSWALISHGRTDTLFKIRVFYFVLVAVSVVIGAQFGVEGVALTYVLAISLVRVPLQVFMTSRQTPVSAWRIYQTFLLYLCSTLGALAIAWTFRQNVALTNPFLGIALTVPVLLGSYTVLIALFPRGRNGIRSMLDIAQHVVKKRSIPKPA